MTEYRQLKENEINAGLLDGFIRRQVVTKCLRRENGAWIAKNAPFIDDWTQKDREWIAADLKNLAGRGGLVYAAYCGGKLAGFASVSAETLGESGEYLELTNIHVTEAMRSFMQRRSGQRHTARRSCTSPPIRRWRVRRFIMRLAARMRSFTVRAILKPSRATGRWSIGYKKAPRTEPLNKSS